MQFIARYFHYYTFETQNIFRKKYFYNILPILRIFSDFSYHLLNLVLFIYHCNNMNYCTFAVFLPKKRLQVLQRVIPQEFMKKTFQKKCICNSGIIGQRKRKISMLFIFDREIPKGIIIFKYKGLTNNVPYKEPFIR